MKEVDKIYESNRAKLADLAVKSFFRAVRDLSEANHRVVASLPGGRSVRDFFSALADKAELLSRSTWAKLHFFWTDERLVPPDSDDSNYALANRLLLDQLLSRGLLAKDQVHRFPGERTEAGEAIKEYRQELDEVSNGIVHLPVLGVGSDGHVGSLFPRRPELVRTEEKFLLVADSPKPPKRRMTISPGAIRHSTYPFLFFLGEEKQNAHKCFMNDETTYYDCPCKLALSGSPGTCFVVTDLG